MAYSLPDIDYRILLIGRTGHGKSSTGNTIAGKNVFKVSSTSKSETKTCQWSKKVKRFGRIVEVVDTPGIFDTDLNERDVHRELLKALALSTPGFHVIAFVLLKGKFTEEIQKTQEIFFDWFGEGVENFACVILTDTDNDRVKDEFIHNDPHEKLSHLVKACGGNVIALDNKAPVEIKEKQAKRIFEVIDTIKQNNKGEYFTNVAFQLAQKYAMNKYPQELTKDSLLLLENARRNIKLSEEQCRYLDSTFETTTEVANVVAESNNDSTEISAGNLPIFDSSTNERICNTRKASQNEQEDVANLSSILPDTLSDSQRSLPSLVSEVPGKIAQKCANYENSFKLEDEVSGSRLSEEDVSGFGQVCGSAKVKKPSSRKDRKYIPGSATYDIPQPQSPIDDFKNRVNNEENSEELQGFSRYLKKAWRFCKRMCILL